MITTDVILVAVELALLIGFALIVAHMDFAPAALGAPFTATPLPDRPQGVQEEDLPRFVFRAPAASLNPA